MMIRIFVFVSGAILMSLEMLGSRILAPQYGNSVIVWGSLIGVFMAALSAGYWVGGRLADLWPEVSGVATVLCGAGVFVAMIPFITPTVFGIAGAAARQGSLFSSLGLFFIPTMLMGAVSPYAIRLEKFAASRLGSAAGSLYAISTAGSIAGTILTAFWLIPLTGVEMLVELLGAALLLLSSVVVAYAGLRTSGSRLAAIASAGVGVLVMIMALTPRTTRAWPWTVESHGRLIVQRDSFYHRIRITEENGVRLMKFDNWVQTSMLLSDPLSSGFPLPDYFHLAMGVRPQIRNILLVGLGGGTTPKQFLAAYPQIHMDAVEIDSEVVNLARQWFYLPPESDRFHVIVMDGRQYLAHTNKKYDLIIMDAFHLDAIPFHLATREFFELCRQHLTERGIMAFNVISAISGPRSGVLGSVYLTVGDVFPELYLFAVDYQRYHSDLMSRNNCLIAGDGLLLTQSELRASEERFVPPKYARRAIDLYLKPPDLTRAKRLSDDYAPVEDLLKLNDN